MDKALRVSMIQSVGDVCHQSSRLLKCQATQLQQVLQRHSIDVVRYEDELVLDIEDLVDGNDTGVAELGCRAGLAAESLTKAGVVENVRVWDFQGDQAVQFGVPRPPDGAEAPATDAFKQLEPAQAADLVDRGLPGRNGRAKGAATFVAMGIRVRRGRGRGGTVAVGAASFRIPFQADGSAHTFDPASHVKAARLVALWLLLIACCGRDCFACHAAPRRKG